MEPQVTFNPSPTANLHYRKLRSRLKQVLKNLPERRKRQKIYIVLTLPIIYLTAYVTALNYSYINYMFYTMYGFLGILSVLIFLNIIHDAAHNNIFKKQWMNKALLIIFDLIGANSFIWRKRHVLLHHNYQNIAGWDSDIQQSGLIRIFKNDKPTVVSRNQSWLVFFLYPMYLLNWILLRDFKDFFVKNRTIQKVCNIPQKEYFKLFIFKAIFLFYTIGVPVLLGVKLYVALIGLFILLTAGSIFALLALLPPHANDKSKFPVPDTEGQLSVSWLEHQFLTTNDVTMDNWISRHVLGNFNYHIAHHLFPNISSVYAPEITIEIRNYARENGLSYRSYKLHQALYYHYKLIKANAVDDDFLEEDM
ncbi:fatty acid desaturase family protein [Gaetbulibacter saemankumensis]|uniref:fatty acid desaturase family protein n=1 Tax=Gaetbulibacter saemankumensis TaxID=311208 RepID=UPI000408352A|nr:fatty acid desaturase [Gaetbulibacter saemankumensis]